MIALIKRIVSVGMTECFGYQIELEPEIVDRRGVQGLDLKLKIEGSIRELDQVGGGLVDVLSFILQVAVVKLTSAAPVLILDEPFKHLSKNYLSRISELVNSLATMMDLQIIIVTHETQLVAGDRVYRLVNTNGETEVVDDSDD